MLLTAAVALQLMAGVTAVAFYRSTAAASGTDAPDTVAVDWNLSGADVPRAPVRDQTGAPPSADEALPLPVRVDIPRLGVSAPVDELGLNPDATVAVPSDFERTGWYRGLEVPGEVGTAVIIGHVDSFTGPAVFFRVPELVAGDEILVTRADDSVVRFVVERTERYQKRAFPTDEVYGKAQHPALRLITCGGAFDEDTRSYTDNVVVYASTEEKT